MISWKVSGIGGLVAAAGQQFADARCAAPGWTRWCQRGGPSRNQCRRSAGGGATAGGRARFRKRPSAATPRRAARRDASATRASQRAIRGIRLLSSPAPFYGKGDPESGSQQSSRWPADGTINCVGCPAISLTCAAASTSTWSPSARPVWGCTRRCGSPRAMAGCTSSRNPNAGKMKRIRNNPQVEIAPSTIRGRALGPYVPATARVAPDPAAARQAIRAQILAGAHSLAVEQGQCVPGTVARLTTIANCDKKFRYPERCGWLKP